MSAPFSKTPVAPDSELTEVIVFPCELSVSSTPMPSSMAVTVETVLPLEPSIQTPTEVASEL